LGSSRQTESPVLYLYFFISCVVAEQGLKKKQQKQEQRFAVIQPDP
jgi:hypothetical protein